MVGSFTTTSSFSGKAVPSPARTPQQPLPAAGLVSFLMEGPADRQFFPRRARSALEGYPSHLLGGILRVGRVTWSTFQTLWSPSLPAPPHSSPRCRLRAERGSSGLGPLRLGFYADPSTCCNRGSVGQCPGTGRFSGTEERHRREGG